MGMKTPLTMTTSIKLGMGPRCVVLALMALTLLADRAFGQGPAKTTIADIVYRADGSPAAGTLLVTWPDFNTADNKTVAAGTLSATIGNGGAVSLALVPNQGASPAGTYYKVVFQLNDGSSSTEYWVVPSASPTTITAIRSQIVPANVAAQLASRAYVDGQVAA
jgi:trimeric autotransporter adhesin